jgi:hypothetical protein
MLAVAVAHLAATTAAPQIIHPCVDGSTGQRIAATYCDPHAPLTGRVADLIEHMNATERTAYLSPGFSAGLPRLGLPPFTTGEALHGVASGCLAKGNVSRGTGCPSAFPAASALGAAFSDELWREIGEAISTEARAMANFGLSTNLIFFAPNINIVKDVRWVSRSCERAFHNYSADRHASRPHVWVELWVQRAALIFARSLFTPPQVGKIAGGAGGRPDCGGAVREGLRHRDAGAGYQRDLLQPVLLWEEGLRVLQLCQNHQHRQALLYLRS